MYLMFLGVQPTYRKKRRKRTLTITDDEWDGKLCYIITETVELSDYKTVYRIGKEDNFIYSRKRFDIESSELFSSIYSGGNKIAYRQGGHLHSSAKHIISPQLFLHLKKK